MKFISKQQNYRAVLRPGIPREPLTGREAVAAIYAKFEDGAITVTNPKMIEMMKRHPGFGTDFIEAEDGTENFGGPKKQMEPIHTITEMEFGTPGNVINPNKVPGSASLADKMKEIQEFSAKIALEMMGKKEAEIREDERKKIMEELQMKDVDLTESNPTTLEPIQVEEDEEPISIDEIDPSEAEIINPDREPVFEKKELHSEAAILNGDA
jgi:hypothetical protein